MCFSANASFGASIILSVIGVASIKKVQHPSQLIFASIPLFFALQQFSEGILWLSLTHQRFSSLEQFSTYAFLFFAQVVWPLCVPLSIVMIEKREQRKKIGKMLVVVGALISVYLAYCLLSYPVKANILGHHVAYKQQYPSEPMRYGGFLYFIAIIIPPFFSTIKKMWTLGAAILISYILTALYYQHYIVSVWCFFASIISVTVYVLMKSLKHPTTGSIN